MYIDLIRRVSLFSAVKFLTMLVASSVLFVGCFSTDACTRTTHEEMKWKTTVKIESLILDVLEEMKSDPRFVKVYEKMKVAKGRRPVIGITLKMNPYQQSHVDMMHLKDVTYFEVFRQGFFAISSRFEKIDTELHKYEIYHFHPYPYDKIRALEITRNELKRKELDFILYVGLSISIDGADTNYDVSIRLLDSTTDVAKWMGVRQGKSGRSVISAGTVPVGEEALRGAALLRLQRDGDRHGVPQPRVRASPRLCDSA